MEHSQTHCCLLDSLGAFIFYQKLCLVISPILWWIEITFGILSIIGSTSSLFQVKLFSVEANSNSPSLGSWQHFSKGLDAYVRRCHGWALDYYDPVSEETPVGVSMGCWRILYVGESHFRLFNLSNWGCKEDKRIYEEGTEIQLIIRGMAFSVYSYKRGNGSPYPKTEALIVAMAPRNLDLSLLCHLSFVA